MTTITTHRGGPIVTLDPGCELWAMTVGASRRMEARMRGGTDALIHDGGAAPFVDEALGAGGELAVATWAGIPWSPAPFGAPDIGTRTEVRTAAFNPKWNVHLIVRPHNPIGCLWVFVVCKWPRFALAGWIEDHDARRDAYRQDPNGAGHPCYMVPSEALHPMDELKGKTL